MAENSLGITVLIPTYNRAKVLGETLRHLLESTEPDSTAASLSLITILAIIPMRSSLNTLRSYLFRI